MRAALLFVFVVLATVNAQVDIEIDGRVPYITIDDFSVGADVHQVEVVPTDDITSNDTPVSDSSSFSEVGCSGLLGCERDMSITVSEGFVGRTSSSQIFSVNDSEFFEGEWVIGTTKSTASNTLLQYDGFDGSIDLDISGLGGVDLTDGGNAEAFRITVISDLEATYEFIIYSPNGGVCSLDIESNEITGDYDIEDVVVEFDFDDFDGNCDFSNVGAIEVQVPGADALDAIMRSFRAIGPVAVSVSPSPTPSPTPSATPSPVEDCMCHCPIFTCALIFDPDDDENNAYYFDDDDENAGVRTGNVENVVDDENDSDSSSNAVGLVASTVAVALAVVVAF